MTERQKRFADEYLIDLNGTRAYKAAYPSVKKDGTAGSCAHKLLKKADVAAYIAERLEEIKSAKTADAAEVMEYLTSVMRGKSKANVVVTELCGDGYSEAKVVEKPPDEKERLKAAELLGKRFNIFANTVKVDGAVPVVISGGDELDD